MRLDRYLVEHLGVTSRTKAKELIAGGDVLVDGVVVAKSSFEVANHKVELLQKKQYVSRAAYKLKNFLEQICYNPKEKIALDIGSSTGGFTQVLLEKGAKRVVCVDVGTNQLHKSLREHPKVELYEQTDIRDFIYEPFELVVSDVSFISLLKILDAIDRLAKSDIILLFKPQFEVGKEVKRDKKGVVLDQKAIKQAMQNFEEACKKRAWKLKAKEAAAITGKDGNLEYCYYFQK